MVFIIYTSNLDILGSYFRRNSITIITNSNIEKFIKNWMKGLGLSDHLLRFELRKDSPPAFSLLFFLLFPPSPCSLRSGCVEKLTTVATQSSRLKHNIVLSLESHFLRSCLLPSNTIFTVKKTLCICRKNRI